MNKIFKILIISFLFCFSLGCTKKKPHYENAVVFSYKVLNKEIYNTNNTAQVTTYFGSILLNIPDTTVTYISIFNAIKQICISENIISAKFYKKADCWIDGKEIFIDSNQYNNCYLGSIDLRNRGNNWKHTISRNDFQFHNFDGLPIKIKIK